MTKKKTTPKRIYGVFKTRTKKLVPDLGIFLSEARARLAKYPTEYIQRIKITKIGKPIE